MKEKIKTKTYDDLVLELTFDKLLSLDRVKEHIQEVQLDITKNLIEDKWKTIFDALPTINLPDFAKSKLFHKIKKQNKNKFFYSNLHKEEILNILNVDIEQWIQKFHMKFNQKISNDVQKYILVDRIFKKNIDNNTIELISKGAIVLAQNLLNQVYITEEEIHDQVFLFVKNYQFDEMNQSSNHFLIFYFLRKNFFNILLLCFLLLIIKFLFFKK